MKMRLRIPPDMPENAIRALSEGKYQIEIGGILYNPKGSENFQSSEYRKNDIRHVTYDLSGRPIRVELLADGGIPVASRSFV